MLDWNLRRLLVRQERIAAQQWVDWRTMAAKP
jgi:hypothetical protein